MYIKVDLDKVLTRADQVEVGKEYYLFNLIHPSTEVSSDEGLIITSVTDDEEYPFESGNTTYCYAYPIPEKKTRPMTIQEIFDYWKNHRTEIYKILVEDEDDENNDYFYFNTIQAIDVKHEVVFFNPTDYGQCFTPREMFDYVTKEDGTKFEVEYEN